ncbi:MAG: hypothetical protein ABFD54_05415 [Armatimonadota bacterium]|nr:hypothetical protein [bacterium]
MIKRLAAYTLVLLAFSCVYRCAYRVGICAEKSVDVIDAGSLKINIITSETAELFFVVDRLSQADDSHPNQYVEYFGKLEGGLSEEDRELLAQHALLRKKYDWHLNPIFYTADDLDSTLSKAVKTDKLTKQEAQTEKRVLLHFKTRVDKLVAEENQTIIQFQNELSTKKPEIKAFTEAISKLFGYSKQEIQLYLIPNPNHNSVGWGNSNDIFMLPVSDSRKSYQWLLQEVFLSRAYQQNALTAAVRPEVGLDKSTLIHGMAFALVPGIFHESSSDQLAETVARYAANGASSKDWYVRNSMYGLALRPLLKEAIYDKQQSLQTFLPRAVDAWLVLTEIDKASPADQTARPGNEHDFKKDLKHSIFVFGSCDSKLFTEDLRKSTSKHLFGRNHSSETYNDMLTNNSKPGDTIILLISLDSSERVPSEYSDLLPVPWPEVESKLRQGQIVAGQGNAREMSVFLVAAPTHDQMCQLFRQLINEKKF